MEFVDKLKVEVLNLDLHKEEFCKILLDLHKHYYSNSNIDSARASLYFDDVMQKNLEKFWVYVCSDRTNDIVGFAACYESISFVELQSARNLGFLEYRDRQDLQKSVGRAFNYSSFLSMAISTKVDTAHQICILTAFSLLPKNFLILIHLKNISS